MKFLMALRSKKIVFLLFVVLIYPPVSVGNEPSPIGFETVEQAFKALETDDSAGMQEYEGWTLFNQKKEGKYILWSFTPVFHPAHPSAIRRKISKQGDQVFIEMDALCQSARAQCDLLIEEFKQINERIKQDQSGGS